jgi:hypothetical protein
MLQEDTIEFIASSDILPISNGAVIGVPLHVGSDFRTTWRVPQHIDPQYAPVIRLGFHFPADEGPNDLGIRVNLASAAIKVGRTVDTLVQSQPVSESFEPITKDMPLEINWTLSTSHLLQGSQSIALHIKRLVSTLSPDPAYSPIIHQLSIRYRTIDIC